MSPTIEPNNCGGREWPEYEEGTLSSIYAWFEHVRARARADGSLSFSSIGYEPKHTREFLQRERARAKIERETWEGGPRATAALRSV